MDCTPSIMPEARIGHAIEEMYRIFAAPTPSIIEGCPCCTEARGVDVLLATPLRELSGKDLWSYVADVFFTVGSARDFRYLLPRILEVSVSDRANANYPEVVLSKLSLSNWHRWRPQERQAVLTFVDAWFELAMTRDLSEAGEGWIGTEAEGVLCGAARAGLPLIDWLVRLHTPVAAPLLSDMKYRFPHQMSAFWEEVPDAFRLFSTILTQGQA